MHDNRVVLPRFYSPDLIIDGPFPLPPDEAHHLTRVLRLAPGESIEVFDGNGGAYRAEIVAAVRDRVTVRVAEPLVAQADPALRVTVVQAILKGSSMDDAVRDATMMGAAAIQPVLTEHTVVKAAQARRDETRNRWERVALAAVKQSRRVTLPTIAAVIDLGEWLGSASRESVLMFVEPSAPVAGRSLRSLELRPGASITVLLGPEGGWSAAETTRAVDGGCVPVSLGPMTLRAESMPVAALAAVWTTVAP